MNIENKLEHPEILYILKTDRTSVSEITEHKVLSHSVYGKRQHPKPERLIHRYVIENHRDVELTEDESFSEDRHLTSTIGNIDPWISSTLVFRNIDDANIRREKELERINKKPALQNTLLETLSKYKGEDIRRVIGQIQQDIQKVLEGFIDFNEGLYGEDFPIEFENEIGKWKIESSGEVWVQPKIETQHIEVNVTIKPTGNE